MDNKNIIEVCFTGFHKANKAVLIAIAESLGWKVRHNVTKHLDILVCGYNEGPCKRQKALAQGVPLYSEAMFIRLTRLFD